MRKKILEEYNSPYFKALSSNEQTEKINTLVKQFNDLKKLYVPKLSSSSLDLQNLLIKLQ